MEDRRKKRRKCTNWGKKYHQGECNWNYSILLCVWQGLRKLPPFMIKFGIYCLWMHSSFMSGYSRRSIVMNIWNFLSWKINSPNHVSSFTSNIFEFSVVSQFLRIFGFGKILQNSLPDFSRSIFNLDTFFLPKLYKFL